MVELDGEWSCYDSRPDFDRDDIIREAGLEAPYEDVRDLHRACGLPCHDSPRHPTGDEVALRKALVVEEVEDELLPALDAYLWDEAVDERDLTLIGDAIADSIYVLLGTAATFGLPMAEIWRRVHESNMAKVKDGVLRREDGKILKPSGWTPPDVAGAIRDAMGEK